MNRTMRFLDRLKVFRKDRSGVAAVEFALFAPFLMASLLGVSEVGLMAFDKMKLTSGVRSASQYVLVGGEDETVIKSLIASGSGLSEGALTVNVTLYCNCAVDDAAAVCNSNCSDDDTPRVYRQISADTVSARLFKSWPLTSVAEVRTR